MAMSLLYILFIILVSVSLLSIILLYKLKSEKSQSFVFYFLCVWSLLITFINFTSLPSNYTVSKVLSSLWGLLTLISVFVKIKYTHKNNLSNLLVSASTFLGLLDLFFY